MKQILDAVHFMRYFKEYLVELFVKYKKYFQAEVPEDFLIHYLVGSFAETVKWWIVEEENHSPEEIAQYYMAMIGF